MMRDDTENPLPLPNVRQLRALFHSKLLDSSELSFKKVHRCILSAGTIHPQIKRCDTEQIPDIFNIVLIFFHEFAEKGCSGFAVRCKNTCYSYIRHEEHEETFYQTLFTILRIFRDTFMVSFTNMDALITPLVHRLSDQFTFLQEELPFLERLRHLTLQTYHGETLFRALEAVNEPDLLNRLREARITLEQNPCSHEFSKISGYMFLSLKVLKVFFMKRYLPNINSQLSLNSTFRYPPDHPLGGELP